MRQRINLTIRPADLQVSVNHAARYFGGSRYRVTPRAHRDIESALKMAHSLIAPAAVIGLYPVKTISPDGRIDLANGQHLKLSCSAGRADVKTLAAAVATLGIQLEQTCRQLAGQGKIYESTLLDAVGTGLLDAVAEVCRKQLAKEARKRNTFNGIRLAPGLIGCDLSQQASLVRLAGAQSIGVGLNPDHVMSPVKSISMFSLFTCEPTDHDAGYKCRGCDRHNCQFRTSTQGE